MLSGIGPADHLAEHGIVVLAEGHRVLLAVDLGGRREDQPLLVLHARTHDRQVRLEVELEARADVVEHVLDALALGAVEQPAAHAALGLDLAFLAREAEVEQRQQLAILQLVEQ